MTDKWTDKRTDICDCRVAFATEKFDLCGTFLFLFGDFCPPHQLRFCTFLGCLVEGTRVGWLW